MQPMRTVFYEETGSFYEEAGRGAVSVSINGEMTAQMVDALNDFIVHQKKLLDDKMQATESMAV